MKFHRMIEHYETVCPAQKLGSYAQGQGHRVTAITQKLLKQI